MPNAKEVSIADLGRPKILLVGSPGSGKTSQILTLPGKTFVYLFDPAALSTLRGHDIDYEMFVPQVVNLSVQSLTKGKGDPITKAADAHKIYNAWEADYDKKAAEGFFNDYDNIVIDSFTTFSDLVMDRVLFINGRQGRWPQQDDWTAQMGVIKNAVRTFTGQHDMLFVATGHDQFKQDEQTKRMINQLMLTGQLRTKLPLLFSDIWHTDCVSTETEIKYQIQTRPSRMNPTVRCSFRGLDMFENATIEDWNNPKAYGLGKIIATQDKE